MSDQQQAPVSRHGAQRIERLRGVEAARERRVDGQQRSRCSSLQPSAASSAVWCARTRGLNSTTSNVRLQSRDRDAGGARLLRPRSVKRRAASVRVPCGSASA